MIFHWFSAVRQVVFRRQQQLEGFPSSKPAIGQNCAAVLTIIRFAIKARQVPHSVKDCLRIHSESVEPDSRRHQQLAEGPNIWLPDKRGGPNQENDPETV